MNITFEIKDKEYKLPEFINCEQYNKIFKLKDVLEDQYFSVKLLSILSGCPEKDLELVNYNHIKQLSLYAGSMFPKKESPFVDRFTIDDVEYGFIDSWKRFSFGEWVDLDTLINLKQEEITSNLHIILAIIYRPIISEDKKTKKYVIEEYDSDKMQVRAEIFKTKLDIRTYFGTLVFFSLFAKKYMTHIQQSSTMKVSKWTQMKYAWKWRKTIKALLRGNGDGMSLSIDSATMILENTLMSYRKPLWKRLINSLFFWRKTRK